MSSMQYPSDPAKGTHDDARKANFSAVHNLQKADKNYRNERAHEDTYWKAKTLWGLRKSDFFFGNEEAPSFELSWQQASRRATKEEATNWVNTELIAEARELL